jgi:predicted deacylase
MSEFSLFGNKAASGERSYFTLPVTTAASGLTVVVPVHIVNGVKTGPVLLLTALSHGDAVTGLECIRRVLETVDATTLKGTIVAVPCQNSAAFEWGKRNTPIDSYNMNRTFPGNANGWFTEQLSAVISPLCETADVLIDWHGGEYGSAINYMLLKLGIGGYSDEVMKLGLAFGLEYLYGGKPAGPAAAYAGSLSGYMEYLGKPALVAEIGSGMDLTFDLIGGSTRGVFNIMKVLGMIEGEPVLPQKQWLIKDRPLIRPKNGGMFYPLCGPEYLNKVVRKGTKIAEIRNPLTLKVIETIEAPCEETVFLDMRGLMAKVHPGDYAYILGDRSTAEMIENE